MLPGSASEKREPRRGGSARHSRPSKLESTGPRKYRSPCGGTGPSNLTRIAMLSSSARLAMLPTCMVAASPLRPLMASPGIPHKGASLGNSRNSAAITGAPSSTMKPAVRAACASGGLPTGMWALTSAVSSPISPSNMAAAVGSDCEKKKLVSIVKKPRKKMTKMSRRARSSRVLSASSTTTSVTPASRPSTVRWVTRVAPIATASRPSSHQVPGRGLALTASQPRQASTAPASVLHQSGRLPTCGRITHPITSSRNSVSRLSRGSAARRARRLPGPTRYRSA